MWENQTLLRSLDLSWDLRKRFSGGVFRRIGMFNFPFSAIAMDLIKSLMVLRIDLKVARRGIANASMFT